MSDNQGFRGKYMNGSSPNTVHFTSTMAAVKSIRMMGCDARGRSG
jgi:hypothetical protein